VIVPKTLPSYKPIGLYSKNRRPSLAKARYYAIHANEAVLVKPEIVKGVEYLVTQLGQSCKNKHEEQL